MRKIILKTIGFLYKYLVRRVFFLLDSESIHTLMTNFGEVLGKTKFLTFLLKFLLRDRNSMLEQSMFNIRFQNPIGLAAGFDYKAQLTQVLPMIGFGFGSVGTITNMPYEGNPKPRLGRLVKSKSLMVNKGFKNEGIERILKKIEDYSFKIPIGLSIGQTNTPELRTVKQAIIDIMTAFKKAEKSKAKFSYYELNISCPNLLRKISFYDPQNLESLLLEIKKLKIKKPVFIKMPIEKNNKETLAMLKIIVKYPIQGVIFGNLQKDRSDPAFDPKEIKKYRVGNFSGKPTEKRSNELIKLTYKNFGKSLLIIGCGGVFNATDAYTKIKLGSSLVQLITGLIYEGPQLPAQINWDLMELIKKDGISHISKAIGINVK